MMVRGRDTIVGFSIGVVAERTGMHPQTLREYERQGLIEPARTPGGTRRYRESEIVRLARISQLTDLGMSLAAVRHVLDLDDRIRHLESLLAQRGVDARGQRDSTPGTGLARRSMSVEIVHVPRPRRGPRWRNDT